MIPTDEVLESFDLPAEEPAFRFLERLFARFNARVPFETVSKILRHADVEDPRDKPRRPELFWEDHLAWGAGGTCFARVAAFDALLSSLGFRVEKLLGRVEADFDHSALRVWTERGPVLADVGFPLPALLPETEGETETPLTGLGVRRTARGWGVEFTAGVPDGPGALEIFAPAVDEEEFASLWRGTFRPGSRFLQRVGIRRMEEQRVVSFARGVIRVDDRHSRLALPVDAPRAGRLAELFKMDEAPIARALTLAGDVPAEESPRATLTAYLETHSSPDAAFAAIGSPEGYGELMSGVAHVSPAAGAGGQWRLELSAPEGEGAVAADARFSEEVRAEPESRRLRVRRLYANRSYESAFEAAELRGRTYLLRSVEFEGNREDLLRNDSARGRLAGTLAVDLLAWSRRIR